MMMARQRTDDDQATLQASPELEPAAKVLVALSGQSVLKAALYFERPRGET